MPFCLSKPLTSLIKTAGTFFYQKKTIHFKANGFPLHAIYAVSGF